MQVLCQKSSQSIEIHGYTGDYATRTSFQSESTTSEIETVNLRASISSWMSEKPSEGE